VSQGFIDVCAIFPWLFLLYQEMTSADGVVDDSSQRVA